MRLINHHNPIHAESPVSLLKDDAADFGVIESDDPLDLGFEHGNIVAYDDDFSFHATVLSTGWKNVELE